MAWIFLIAYAAGYLGFCVVMKTRGGDPSQIRESIFDGLRYLIFLTGAFSIVSQIQLIKRLTLLAGPLILSLAGIGLAKGCLTCTSGWPLFDRAATVALLFESIVLTVAILGHWAILRKASVMLAGAMLEVQIVAFTLAPKFCPYCLSAAIVHLTVVASAKEFVNPGPITGNRLTGFAGVGPAALALILLGAMPSLNMLRKKDAPQYVGKHMSPLTTIPIKGPDLVIVTLNGCSHCADALNYLTKSRVKWTQMGFCGQGNASHCFDPSQTPCPAPLLLAVNKKGMVVAQQEGWAQNDLQGGQMVDELAKEENQ